jgi:hypothetical protein
LQKIPFLLLRFLWVIKENEGMSDSDKDFKGKIALQSKWKRFLNKKLRHSIWSVSALN